MIILAEDGLLKLSNLYLARLGHYYKLPLNL